MVALDLVDPALRSRGAPKEKARELYETASFQQEMRALFSGGPAGRLVLPTMDDALERIAKLDHRLQQPRPPPVNQQAKYTTYLAPVPCSRYRQASRNSNGR